MRYRDRIIAIASLTGIVVLATAATAAAAGFVVNRTPSFPLGLYAPVAGRPIVGDLVTFCLPERVARFALGRGYVEPGPCASGTVPIIKRVVAVAGDSYAIGRTGVWAKGRLLVNSAPIPRDGDGLPMPALQASGVVPTGAALLMSDYSPVSFDGRYFGPVDQRGIRSIVRPILTWG